MLFYQWYFAELLLLDTLRFFHVWNIILFAFTERVIPSSLFCRQLLVSSCYLGLQLCPGPWSCILRSVRLNHDYFQLFIISVSATVLANRYSVCSTTNDVISDLNPEHWNTIQTCNPMQLVQSSALANCRRRRFLCSVLRSFFFCLQGIYHLYGRRYGNV